MGLITDLLMEGLPGVTSCREGVWVLDATELAGRVIKRVESGLQYQFHMVTLFNDLSSHD